MTFSLSFPLWNNGQREIEVSRARVNRDVARAIREDLERAVRRDVSSAYDTYETATAAVELARSAVTVAQQSYRMQELRYRSGASTILDLLDSQVSLARQKPAWFRPVSNPAGLGAARSHSRPPTLLEQGCSVRLIHLAMLMLAAVAGCNRAESEGKGPKAVEVLAEALRPCRSKPRRPDPIRWWMPFLLLARSRPCSRSSSGPKSKAGWFRSWFGKGRWWPGARRCSRSMTPSSKAQVAQITAERDLARQSLERTRDLLSQKASSQAELERAEATMRSNEAQLERLKVRLDRTLVRSPFAGVMGQRFVSLGDYVTSDTGWPPCRPFRPSGPRSRCRSATPIS